MAHFLPSVSLRQALFTGTTSGNGSGAEDVVESTKGVNPPDGGNERDGAEDLPRWEQFAIGLEESWELARTDLLGEVQPRAERSPAPPAVPAESSRRTERECFEPTTRPEEEGSEVSSNRLRVLDLALEAMAYGAGPSDDDVGDSGYVPATGLDQAAYGSLAAVTVATVVGRGWARRHRWRRSIHAAPAAIRL